MPDSFLFLKRRESENGAQGNGFAEARNSGAGRKAKSSPGQQQRSRPTTSKSKPRGREGGDDSDVTPDDDLEGIDDLDLRADEIDSNASGSDEDDDWRHRRRRGLRLAKLYLQSVKDGNAAGASHS